MSTNPTHTIKDTGFWIQGWSPDNLFLQEEESFEIIPKRIPNFNLSDGRKIWILSTFTFFCAFEDNMANCVYTMISGSVPEPVL